MTSMDAPERRNKNRLFIALCAAVLAVSGVYVYRAAGRSVSARQRVVEYRVGSAVRAAQRSALTSLRKQPHVAFQNLEPGPSYGTLAYVPLDAPGGARQATDLSCRRLYVSAGTLICLGQSEGFYSGYLLDDSMEVRHIFRLLGVPSRARASRDGRTAAYTVFTAADSYMTRGFSTRTVLVDGGSGARIADLESFQAWKDGAPFQAVDFNYWGVTFGRDPSTFFATLGTGGHTYLVEGDIETRRVTVRADGIECPSLSPDETRIAFKKKTETPGRWQPAVFDRRTGVETVLPDTRRLDDQIEWLDDERLLYAIVEVGVAPVRSSIWMIRADGTQPPSLFIADAASPAVVRTEQPIN